MSDAVIQDFTELKSRLTEYSYIVIQPHFHFESGIIKVLEENNTQLTNLEKKALEDLMIITQIVPDVNDEDIMLV